MRDEFVQKKIKQLLNERNWTLYRLAKESHISYSTLNNIFHNGHVPTIHIIMKICEAFGITMAELFEEKGSEVKQLNTADQQLIVEFHSLPRENKELAAAYMKGILKLAAASDAEDIMQM